MAAARAAPSLMRMASAEGLVDLRHPTPDMHSMQGVNMRNVEKIEQSAEELSQGGSDIGEEIRKMKQEQDMASRRSSLASQREGRVGRQASISAVLSDRSRNASTSSYAHSIVDVNTAARWGGYSPGGFVTSPTASVSRVSSFRRPSAMPEPVQEGRPLDSPLTSPSSQSYFPPARRPSQQSLAATDEDMLSQGDQDGHVHRQDSHDHHNMHDVDDDEWEHMHQHHGDEEDQDHHGLDRVLRVQNHHDDAEHEAEHETPDEQQTQQQQQQQHHHQEQQQQKQQHDGEQAPAPAPESDHVLQIQPDDHEYEPGREYRPSTPPERPHSADTFRQARSLFRDFDGVHFSPTTEEFVELDKAGNEVKRISSQQVQRKLMQRQSRPISHFAPPPGENMVFYPAPVPRMLNLPKRLSQGPSAALQANRRSEFFGALPADVRKSAPWLPALDFEHTDPDHDRDPYHNHDHNHNHNHDLDQDHKHSHDHDEDPTSPTLGMPASPDRISPSKQRQSMFNPRMSRMSMANLPPQLRASVFFDQQGVQTNVQVQSESAVATLDSILAASVNAPVNVFTDHPFAGNVGKDIYAKERPRRSTTLVDLAKTPGIPQGDETRRHTRAASSGVFGRPISMLQKRNSITSMLTDLGNPGGKKLQKRNSRMSLATDLGLATGESRIDNREGEEEAAEYETERSVLNQPREGELADEENDDYEEGQLDDNNAFYVQPTTLLAELQLRKAQQKSRNRNAGTAFPNGMHSTLLELDAVAQIEKTKRKGQRTRLAWEDPAVRAEDEEREDENDEVPLGVLYPARNGLINRGKGQQSDWDRPLGLIERREMEDNEPLSRRRNRLRGISPERELRTRFHQMRHEELLAAQAEAVPLPPDDDEESTNEPLAQRLQRLKQKKVLDSALGDVADEKNGESAFTDDVLSHFGGLSVTEDSKAATAPKADQDLQVAADSASTPRAEQQEGGEEETLGQRRARLQREREESGQRNVSDPASLSTARPQLRASSSLANLLTAHPIHASSAPTRAVNAPAAGSLLAMSSKAEEENRKKLRLQNARSASHNVLPKSGMATSKSTPAGLARNPASGYFASAQQQQQQQQQQAYMQQNMHMYPQMAAGVSYGYGYNQMVNPLSYQQFAAPAYGNMSAMGMPYQGIYGQMPAQQQWQMAGGAGAGGGMHPGMYMNPMGMMGFEEPMDPAQRTMIDRWRESVGQ
ncbi:hypothetical protein MBLNU459_g4165t1 [Dothideomycetes sp. NU459]